MKHRMFLALGVLLACPATPPTAAPKPVPPQVEAEPGPADEPSAEDSCEGATQLGPFKSAVHGMAVDAEGTLWWADSYPGKDQVSRVYRRAVGSTEDEPTEITGGTLAGLRFEGDRLLVCDVAKGRVFAVVPDGAIALEWTVPNPWNTARLTDGSRVAVTHAGEVWALADDGSTTKLFDGLDAPFGIAPGSEGTMWITEQGRAEGRVTRRDASGAVVQTLDGSWDNPEGIVVTDAGLVVADTSEGAIYSVAADGSRTLAAEVELPIAATAAGQDVIVGTAGASPSLWRIRACP